jgi:hypothetical protein
MGGKMNDQLNQDYNEMVYNPGYSQSEGWERDSVEESHYE